MSAVLKNEVKALMLEYAKVFHEGGTSFLKISTILHEITHEIINEVMENLKEEQLSGISEEKSHGNINIPRQDVKHSG